MEITNVNKLIVNILWHINNSIEIVHKNADLVKEPLKTAKIIRNACQMIQENRKDSDIVEFYIDMIEKLSIGHIVDISPVDNVCLRKAPASVTSTIAHFCNKIIDIIKTDNDIALQKLNEKYRQKWLYFEGVNKPKHIIWIDRLFYNGDDIAWSGNQIILKSEESEVAGGVLCDYVICDKIRNLGYLYIEPNDNRPYIEILDEWMSVNLVQSTQSRELSDVEVKERILDNISNAFKNTYRQGSIKWPNLFDSITDEL